MHHKQIFVKLPDNFLLLHSRFFSSSAGICSIAVSVAWVTEKGLSGSTGAHDGSPDNAREPSRVLPLYFIVSTGELEEHGPWGQNWI